MIFFLAVIAIIAIGAVGEALERRAIRKTRERFSQTFFN